LAGFLYAFINEQNHLVKLRLQIPEIQKKVALMEQENTQLQFQIDQFEQPSHLLELRKTPQFSHLKQPVEDEIILVPIPPHA
jgi:hypothetical protein